MTTRHPAEEQKRERQLAERIRQPVVEILKEPERGESVRDRLVAVAGS